MRERKDYKKLNKDKLNERKNEYRKLNEDLIYG